MLENELLMTWLSRYCRLWCTSCTLHCTDCRSVYQFASGRTCGWNLLRWVYLTCGRLSSSTPTCSDWGLLLIWRCSRGLTFHRSLR